MERLLGLKRRICNGKFFSNFSNYFHRFIVSDIYIITLFLVAIINWKFKIIWLALIFHSLIIFLIFIFKESKTKFLPIAFSLMIAIRFDLITNYFLPLLITASILTIIFIISFIRKNPKLNNGIFIGMILILFSKIFSLVNTPVLYDSLKEVALWAFYSILLLFLINLEDNKIDIDFQREYLAKVFIYLSLGVFIEIVIYYLEYGLGQNIIRFYGSNDVHFGWANTSTVSMLYLIVIPILLYFYTLDQKRYYILLIIGINTLMLHLMLSRGAYLALIILSLPLILKTLHDVKHKTNFVITLIYITIIVLLGLIIIAIPTGYVKDFFDFISSKGLSIEDKELITRIGFNVFQRYPLFGGGDGSARFYLKIAIDANRYDNFLIETLANIGIIGIVSFGYYLFYIIKYSLYKNKFNSYVLLVVIGVIIQGLMETTFYNPLVMVMLVFIFPLLTTEKQI